jgi:hypothetical protein
MAKLELYLTATGYKSSVKLDGQEIHGCYSVELRCKAGEPTTATLGVFCEESATVVCDDAQVITEFKPRLLPPGNTT